MAAADLLLHVIDAASPGREHRMAAVRRTLEAVEAAEVPVVDVYNKCDLVEEAERLRLQRQDPDALCISAATGLGRGGLLDAVTARLALDVRRLVAQFDPADAADRERLAQVYRYGRVHQHVEHDGRITIEADVPARLWSRLQTSEGKADA